MSLRRRDVEQWMSHRLLPKDLRRFHAVCLTVILLLLVISLFFSLSTEGILAIFRLNLSQFLQASSSL